MCIQGPSATSCGQRRLSLDWEDAQAELSLRWTYISFCNNVGFVVLQLNSGWNKTVKILLVGCVGVLQPFNTFRSFRARSVTLATLFLGKPPRQFTSNQCPFFPQ